MPAYLQEYFMRFAILTLLFVLASCGGDDGELKKKNRMESESQLRAENENLAKKAESMESDLKRRHLFYQAIKGTYEGTIETKMGAFNIRLSFSPTLAPFETTRIRQLDEIASDLNLLALNVQIIQWNPNNENASVGCPGIAVRPDIEAGEITIPSSSECRNLYLIKISDRASQDQTQDLDSSMDLARQILNGDIRDVDSISGTIQPSTTAAVYKFIAHKVAE